MNRDALTRLLDAVASGETTVETALDSLRRLPFADVAAARVDHHRELRTGFPEVVYAEGKSLDDTVAVTTEVFTRQGRVLVTRADAETGAALERAIDGLVYDGVSRTARAGAAPSGPAGSVAVVSAGTSDEPVAAEAAETLAFAGVEFARYRDVGVAGLHRILSEIDNVGRHQVVMVVAGMDGALPSVVGGLIGRPVIAVPTSVGYGASFGGLAALLAALNACAPGVVVVNVDNGFGAAVAAQRILAVGAGVSSSPN